MSGLDLDAIDAAEAAMTSGPWRNTEMTSHVVGSTQETEWMNILDNGDREVVSDEMIMCEHDRSNLTGIVAMRNAWPAASAEIRRLRSDIAAARAEADALRGLVGEACDLIDGGGAYCGDCGIGQSSSDIRARAEKAGGR